MLKLLVVAVAALAWWPLITDRLRLWRARGNPISLATALVLFLAAYTPVWVAAGPKEPWSWLGIVVLDLLVCGYFYAALAWSKKKFSGSRSDNRGKP